MWKYAILIPILSCVSRLYAQKPVIDSMVVDEDSSQLILYGSFGSTLGTVRVNGATLTTIQWSDTILIATIPDTGIGSAGPVLVQTQSGISDTNMLTSMSGSYTYGVSANDIGLIDHNEETIIFSIRFDLRKMLVARNGTYFDFEPGRLTKLIIHYYYVSINSGDEISDTTIPEYDQSGNKNFYADIYTQAGRSRDWAFLVPNEVPFGNGFPDMILDSLYQIIPFATAGYPPSDEFARYVYDTALSGTVSYRPMSLIALQIGPTLISPRSDTSDWQPQLTWLTMLDIDSFKVEISTDSTFSTSLLVFSTADTELIPSSLAKKNRYFWRVQGENSEGKSPWSSVWSFGENASSVNQTRDDNSPILQITGSSIQYKVDWDADIVIYNILGQPVSQFRCDGNGSMQSIPFSMFDLRASNYFAVLRNGSLPMSCGFVVQP